MLISKPTWFPGYSIAPYLNFPDPVWSRVQGKICHKIIFNQIRLCSWITLNLNGHIFTFSPLEVHWEASQCSRLVIIHASLMNTFIIRAVCPGNYEHFCWQTYFWWTWAYASTHTLKTQVTVVFHPHTLCTGSHAHANRHTDTFDKLHKQELHRSTHCGPLSHVFKIRWQPHLDLLLLHCCSVCKHCSLGSH